MDEVRNLCKYSDERINDAKIALAYAVTSQVHGKEEADKAKAAAEALFSGGAEGGSIPETAVENISGMLLIDLLLSCRLAPSRSEARRLIGQGGISVNGEKVTEEFMPVTDALFVNGEMMIKKGKKIFHKAIIKK
jgi:tyrosyl-tRNA synthetase